MSKAPSLIATAVNGEIFEVEPRYTNLKFIGGGAYGQVCSADDSVTKRRVAIKRIKDVFRDLMDGKRILRELKLLRHLGGHENIVSILDANMESDLARIIESPQPLTTAHVKYFLYQLLRGLKYTHSAHVLHRDLKPQNILVNSSCELVIADYGLARVVTVDGDGGAGLPDAGADPGAAAAAAAGANLTSYVVTRWYRAPELLAGAPTYDAAIDVWSVGCILAELLGRKPLLRGRDYLDQLRLSELLVRLAGAALPWFTNGDLSPPLVVDVLGKPTESQLEWMAPLPMCRYVRNFTGRRRDWAKAFPKADPLALDLLDKMLEFDPRRRISVVAALAHPFLADYACPDDEPLASPPPPHEFDFDLKPSLSYTELHGLMLAEIAQLRAGRALRPLSTRAKPSLVAPTTGAAAPATAAAAAAPAAGSGAGGGPAAAAAAPAAALPATTTMPSASVVAAALPAAAPPPPAGASTATAPVAASGGFDRPPIPQPPSQPHAARSKSQGDAASAPTAVGGGGLASASGVVDVPHHVPSSSLPPTRPLAAQAPAPSEDPQQQQQLGAALEARFAALERRLLAAVDMRVADALRPLALRLERLEGAVGSLAIARVSRGSSAASSRQQSR